jgi:N4-gp56 family major capsid protein
MATPLPFAGTTGPVDSTDWTKLIETAYDREVSYYLREQTQFRSMIDVKPQRVAMPGDVIVLTRHKDLDVTLTPLSEVLTPDPLAVKDPDRIQITIDEYGDWGIDTLRLNTLAFTQPRQELVNLLGRHQLDKVDGLVKQVMDTGTNVIRAGARTATNLVTATDKFTTGLILNSRTHLRRNLAQYKDGSNYAAFAHPDVVFDIMQDPAWLYPRNYIDATDLYNGEAGKWMSHRFVETTRCKPAATGASGANVYPTYVFGREAIVEVTPKEFGTVVGPVQDPLNRFHPVGYHGIWGAAIYRQESLLRIESSSTYAGN